jgi:hypothetical protein
LSSNVTARCSPVLAQQGEAGSFARRRREGRVAEATPATRRDHRLGTLPDQVGDDLPGVRVGDDGAVGHVQDDVGAVRARLVIAFAGLAVGGTALGLPVIVDQGRQPGVDADDHGPAVPPVAAVGATERLELLPVHRRAAVATVAALDA